MAADVQVGVRGRRGEARSLMPLKQDLPSCARLARLENTIVEDSRIESMAEHDALGEHMGGHNEPCEP